MASETVSVAMATYCGGRYLREQLDSIKNQSYIPTELIVCDDGSTDDSLDILESFAREASFPVKIYRNERNIGYIDNFLKAINLCEGSIIALSDQDDVWEQNKLEMAVLELKRTDALLHSHSATLIDEHGKYISSFQQSNISGHIILQQFDPWSTFFGFTCTFRRELIESVPLILRPVDLIYDNSLTAHDRWITALGFLYGKVVYQNTSLARYRQHGNNLFGANHQTLFQKVKKIRSRYIKYLNKRYNIAKSMIEISGEIQKNGGLVDQNSLSIWQNLEDEYRHRLKIFQHSRNPITRLHRLFSMKINKYPFRAKYQDICAILLMAKC